MNPTANIIDRIRLRLQRPSHKRVARYVDLITDPMDLNAKIKEAARFEPDTVKRIRLHASVWQSPQHTLTVMQHLAQTLQSPTANGGGTLGTYISDLSYVRFFSSGQRVGLDHAGDSKEQAKRMVEAMFGCYKNDPVAAMQVIPLAIDESRLRYTSMDWFMAQFQPKDKGYMHAIRFCYRCMITGDFVAYQAAAFESFRPCFDALGEGNYVNAMLALDMPHGVILNAIEQRFMHGTSVLPVPDLPPDLVGVI